MNIAKLLRICGVICGVAMLALVGGCSNVTPSMHPTLQPSRS